MKNNPQNMVKTLKKKDGILVENKKQSEYNRIVIVYPEITMEENGYGF